MGHKSFRLPRTLLCALLLLTCAVAAHAQFKASVQGSVTDASGAVVPGASVTLTNKETGKVLTTTASDEGFYRFDQLAPGSYSLSAEKTGFKKQVLENVVVNAEAVQGVDLLLTTGELSETVTVTETSVQTLETENANVSKAITTQELRRLPQVGRDPYELLRLTPGVFGSGARGGTGGSVGLPNAGSDTGPGGSNTSVFAVENQPQISANGQRISANDFQIDGVSVNSLTHGGAAVVTPNQESVKEVRVLSSTYSAEDGRNSGAQIKVVSQNGTNEFHGSAFLKYDSPKLNAFNKYGPGFGTNGPERVNNLFRQFGGSLGGPLYLPHFGEGGPVVTGGKDRSFFFFSYEGLRQNNTGTSVRYVETPEFRALARSVRPNSIAARVFSQPGIAPRINAVLPSSCTVVTNFPNCQVLPGGLDIGSPAGAQGQYLSFGALGGPLDGIPDIQRVSVATPRLFRGNQFNTRFDFTPNTRDTIALSTYLTKSEENSANEDSGARPLDDIRNTPTNTAITLTYNRVITTTMLNEARVNFTRFAFNQVEAAAATNFGIPRLEWENVINSSGGGRIRFGAPFSETTPGIFAENTYEFSDTLNLVRGSMAWKFGAVARREQDNNNLNGGSRPIYTFAGPFNFINDAPLFYKINADPRTGGPADAGRHFRTNTYALFAQDDWKYRPNVTLNLGLRWEYFSPLRETDGRLSNLVFPSGNLAQARVVTVSRLFNPDRNNFGPRLGFAYSPAVEGFGNLLKRDRAVFRGGFGISYNRPPDVIFANTRGNPPFFARYEVCCGTSASDFSTPFAGGQILYALGASNSPFSYPINPRLAVGIDPATGAPRGAGTTAPQVEIYGAEPNFPTGYVYVYSLETQYDVGAHLRAEVGYQGSTSHHLVRLVNEKFLYPQPGNFFASAVFFPQPDVNANYNALNARLTRQFANGFQIDANYRFAKSIDQLSNEGPGAVTNQTFPQNNHLERGPSDFDVRHNFNLSGLWDLPFFRDRKDTLGKALGGFELNGILTWHTGFPWTPHTGQCVSTPGGPGLCPSRPLGYFGGVVTDTSNDAFIRGIFPGNGTPVTDPNGVVHTRYFVITDPRNPGRIPGIGRNSFRGPRYFDVDMSVAKRTGLPSFLGEGANFEFRANFFNIFNNLNLQPFGFFSPNIEDPNFGRSERGLAGRVVEFQGRFRF